MRMVLVLVMLAVKVVNHEWRGLRQSRKVVATSCFRHALVVFSLLLQSFEIDSPQILTLCREGSYRYLSTDHRFFLQGMILFQSNDGSLTLNSAVWPSLAADTVMNRLLRKSMLLILG